MNNPVILALDPGVTTGYILASEPLTYIECGEVVNFNDLLPVLNKADKVIIESFTLYPWKAQQQAFSNMPSAEIIGRIKEWCSINGVEVVEQQPSKRIVATDKLLKATGVWQFTQGKKHARDAARHLLAYYLNNGDETVLRSLWQAIITYKESNEFDKVE